MRFIVRERTQHQSEGDNHSSGLRMNLFFFSTFVIFCVIIIRLAIIQFVEAPTMSDKIAALDMRNIPLPPDRGIIFDDTGVKLAYSKPISSLYIMLFEDYRITTTEGRKNRPKAEQMATKIAEISKKLGNPNAKPLTKDDILAAMDLDSKTDNGYSPRRLKAGLTNNEIAYFMEHRSEFVGLDVVEESYRQYDKDTVAVQTVGYTKYFKSTETLHFYDKARENNKSQLLPDQMYLRDELVGFDGVEFSFQDQLRGKNGYKQISINKQYITEEVDKIVPPVKGNNVWLTINKQVQMKTEQAIMDELSYIQTHLISGGRTHPEAKTGYAVAMEVDTGKIVAMASMPDYDTNIWGTGTASVENFKKLNNNYMNGTITGISSGRSANNLDSTVLLGSTIKPLSVFIGLREKLFTTTTDYNDVGIAYFGKDKKFSVRNSQNHSYGYFKTPAKAIEMSSNAFMIDMVGNPLSKRKGALNLWDKYMKEFGLGVLTGIDLPNERKGIADYMDTDATGSVQASLVYASFGQGGKYTPLQLAQYTSTLANEGVRIKPQIVSKITDQSGKVIKTYKREVLNTIKPDPSDKAYWSLIKRGMNTKVDAFNGFPYDFARKTGTSQQDANRKMRDNGVFIAYAPRNHPKLAVAVIIPEGGFGGSSAAPIARKIFDAYDEEYGLDGVPKKAMNAAKTAENSANAKSERLQNNESNH